jgi:hypothetical protein
MERGSKIEKKVKIQKKLGDPEFMVLGIQNSWIWGSRIHGFGDPEFMDIQLNQHTC